MAEDFEITVPEVDLAAEVLIAAGALGARMTGGGFGGCVIALVDQDRVAGCVAQVGRAFAEMHHRAPSCFTVEASEGARLL